MTKNISTNDFFPDSEIGAIEKCPLCEDTNEELADEPINEIEISCEHGSLDSLNSISLVPSISSYTATPNKSYRDRLTIKWIGPNIPTSIIITSTNPFFTKVEIFPIGNTFIVDLFYYLEYSENVTFVSMIKDVITYNHFDKYKIVANPSTSILDISVTVYNPDNHVVEVGFPPLNGMKGGKKRYTDGSKVDSFKKQNFFGSGKNKVTKEDVSAKKIEKFEKTQKELLNGNKRSWKGEAKGNTDKKWGNATSDGFTDSAQYDYANDKGYHSNTVHSENILGSTSVSQTKEQLNTEGTVLLTQNTKKNNNNKLTGLLGESKIVLSRNNEPLKPDIIKVISNLFDLVYGISDIVITIKKWAPKYGFFFDWDVQLMTGSMAFGWGWNERLDNGAYYKLAASVDITIIRAKLKIAFGLEVVKMGAQIYFSLMGAFGATYESDNNPDDTRSELNIGIKGEIVGELGASVDAGKFLHAEIKGVSGIEFRNSYIQIDRSELKLTGNVWFTGIQIQWTADALFGLYEDEDQCEVVRAKKLFQFEFPTDGEEKKVDNWNDITNDLKEDILSLFEGKNKDGKNNKELKKLDIRFYNKEKNHRKKKKNYDKVDLNLLALRFAKQAIEFAKEHPINFDISATAIANEVRSKIDSFPLLFDGFVDNRFVAAFKKDEFDMMLEKFIDPVALEMQNTNY